MEVPNASSHVSISYASPNAAVAERLYAALEAARLRCWIAPRDVRAGESHAAAIVQEINSLRMLVLALSKSTIESTHVLRSRVHPQPYANVDALGRADVRAGSHLPSCATCALHPCDVIRGRSVPRTVRCDTGKGWRVGGDEQR